MDREAHQEMEDLRASPAWAIRTRLEHLTFSFQLHRRNYEELKLLVQPITDPADLLKLWSEDNREAMNTAIAEVERRLHNFLSSSTALVEHTRVHVEDLYEDTAFRAEYQEAVASRLANIPVRRFVQDLRNYSTHYRIPFALASMNWSRDDGLRSSFQLPVKALEKWPNWSELSTQFMASSGENIDLDTLIEDYMAIITRFYEWFRNREFEIHREPLSDLGERTAAILLRLQRQGD